MTEPDRIPIAIVLAAGQGTRMNSDLPKVLCRVAGRPLIEYVIEALREAGIGRMIIVVGYGSDLVRQALADQSGLEFIEQAQQLGTGHAVMMCRPAIAGFHGPVIVVAGDSPMLQSSSLKRLITEYRQARPACILGTLIHHDPAGLGRIMRDADGGFLGIVEDKDCNPSQRQIREVNMSTYLMECQLMLEALDDLSNDNQQNEYYITDVPGILLSRGYDVRALPVLQPCEALSVNTAAQLALVEQELMRGN